MRPNDTARPVGPERWRSPLAPTRPRRRVTLAQTVAGRRTLISRAGVRQDPNRANILEALPGVLNVVLAVASWLKSDDDLIGVVHKPSGTCSINGLAGWKLTDDEGCVVLKAHDKSVYAN